MPAPQFRNPEASRLHPFRRLSLVGLMVLAGGGTPAAHATPTEPPPSRQCAEWRSRVKSAATPPDRHSATLGLAECLLTRAAAAGMTAELRGDHSHRVELMQIFDEAAELLDSDVAKAADGNAPATNREMAWGRRWELLRAFGQMFRAIAAADDSEASKEALMSACVELAIYADDPNEQVVTAARLWQAAAYRRAGRADRTLQMMRPSLGAGSGSAVDFYGRLERCHALADAGRFVAAIALATKIEGKIDEWMIESPQKTRLDARRTAQITRAELYRRWSASLAEKGLDERSAEALGSANAIEAGAKDEKHGILELDTTVAPLPPLDAGDSNDAPSR